MSDDLDDDLQDLEIGIEATDILGGAKSLPDRLHQLSAVRSSFDEAAVAALLQRSKDSLRALNRGASLSDTVRIRQGATIDLKTLAQLRHDLGQPLKVKGERRRAEPRAASRSFGGSVDPDDVFGGVVDPAGRFSASGALDFADGPAVAPKRGYGRARDWDEPNLAPDKERSPSMKQPLVPKAPVMYADAMSTVSILKDPKFPSLDHVRSLLDEVRKADAFAKNNMLGMPSYVLPGESVEASRILREEFRFDLTYNGVDYSTVEGLRSGKLDPARQMMAENLVALAIASARANRYSTAGGGVGDRFGLDLIGGQAHLGKTPLAYALGRGNSRLSQSITPFYTDIPGGLTDYLFGDFDARKEANSAWVDRGASAISFVGGMFFPRASASPGGEQLLLGDHPKAAAYRLISTLRSQFKDPVTGKPIHESLVGLDEAGNYRLFSTAKDRDNRARTIPGYSRGLFGFEPGAEDFSGWTAIRDQFVFLHTANPFLDPSSGTKEPKLIGGTVHDGYDPTVVYDLGGEQFKIKGLKDGKAKMSFGADSLITLTREQIEDADFRLNAPRVSSARIQLDHVLPLAWIYEHGGRQIAEQALKQNWEEDPESVRMMTILARLGTGANPDQLSIASEEFNEARGAKGPAETLAMLKTHQARVEFNRRFRSVMASERDYAFAHGWADPNFLALERKDRLAMMAVDRGYDESNRLIRPLQELYLSEFVHPDLLEQSLHRQLNFTAAAGFGKLAFAMATWKYTPQNQIYLMARSTILPAWNALFAPKGERLSKLGKHFRNLGSGLPIPFPWVEREGFRAYVEAGNFHEVMRSAERLTLSGRSSHIFHPHSAFGGESLIHSDGTIRFASWRQGFDLGIGRSNAFGGDLLETASKWRAKTGLIRSLGEGGDGFVDHMAMQRYVKFLETGDESVLPSGISGGVYTGRLKMRVMPAGAGRKFDPRGRRLLPGLQQALTAGGAIGSDPLSEHVSFLRKMESRDRWQKPAMRSRYVFDPEDLYIARQGPIELARRPTEAAGPGAFTYSSADNRAYLLGELGKYDGVIQDGMSEAGARSKYIAKDLFGAMQTAEWNRFQQASSSVSGREVIRPNPMLVDFWRAVRDPGYTPGQRLKEVVKTIGGDLIIKVPDYTLRGNPGLLKSVAEIWTIETALNMMAPLTGMTSSAQLDFRSIDYGKGGFYGAWTKALGDLETSLAGAKAAQEEALKLDAADRLARTLGRLESEAWNKTLGITSRHERMMSGLRASLFEVGDVKARVRLAKRVHKDPALWAVKTYSGVLDEVVATSPLPFNSYQDALSHLKHLQDLEHSQLVSAEANVLQFEFMQGEINKHLDALPGARELLNSKPGIRRTIMNVAATYPRVPAMAGRVAHIPRGLYEAGRSPFVMMGHLSRFASSQRGISRAGRGLGVGMDVLGYATGAMRFMRAQDLASQDWAGLADEQKAELDEYTRPSALGFALDAGTTLTPAGFARALPLAVFNVVAPQYIRGAMPQAAKDDRDARLLASRPTLAREYKDRIYEERLYHAGFAQEFRNSYLNPQGRFSADSAAYLRKMDSLLLIAKPKKADELQKKRDKFVLDAMSAAKSDRRSMFRMTNMVSPDSDSLQADSLAMKPIPFKHQTFLHNTADRFWLNPTKVDSAVAAFDRWSDKRERARELQKSAREARIRSTGEAAPRPTRTARQEALIQQAPDYVPGLQDGFRMRSTHMDSLDVARDLAVRDSLRRHRSGK